MGKSNGVDLVRICQNALFVYLNILTDILINAELSLSVKAVPLQNP
jgi:hypothetical protein